MKRILCPKLKRSILNKVKSVLLLLFMTLVFSNSTIAQCASNATNTADEDIFNVTFGTLNNTSGCATTGGTGSILNEYSNYAYAGFPGGIPTVNRGCTIPFSVQIGTCGGNYNNAVAIYIDWNNDADFVDAGENVYLSGSTTIGPHTETGNITIPATAALGNCKMRVVNVETTPTSITPCGTYSWGETEDYFINVANGGGVAPYVSSSVTQLVTGSVSQCATLQQVICIPIVMGAGCTAGNLTQFQLGAGSSTNLPADVSKIHIFYTGTTNVYTASNEFVIGGTIPAGASNTINGSQALVPNATNYFWVTYDMNNGSTIGDLLDGSCTQIAVGGVNQVPSTTSPAGSGTIVTCPCSFSLGNDVTLCAPFTYTLNGPSGFDTYTWTPGGASTQNLVVSSAGTYTCSATLINGGLVANGNFSSGNTGFSSNYVLGPGGTWGPLSNPGTYSVTNNPNSAHTNFYSFGDHTTGTGNMLVCNGSSVANDVAWSQTITVTPNTFYNFSAWVASTENTTSGSEAQLQFSINGSLIGPVYSAPLTGASWANFFVNWNSGSSTSAVIKIVDQNTSGGANDFALDDINFERICTYSDAITINSGSTATLSVPPNTTICNGGTIAASTFTSSTAGVTYTWSNTNPSIGLAASGTGNTPSFTAINTGTTSATAIITVTPSIGSCIGTPKSYTLTINPSPTITVNSPTTCSGVSTILTANGATSYSWSTGASTQTVSVSPLSQTVYTVSGTTTGCTGTSASTVFVSAALSVSANSSTICSGTSTVLTASGATSYTWSTGATTSTISVSPTTNTVYTFAGETSGCTGTNSVAVTVNTIPSLTVSATNSVICLGNSTILNASGASTYTWTGGVTNGVTFSPTNTATYTVTATSAAGCTNSAVQSITVNTSPTVTVNSATTCAGVATPLTANGATSYLWSTGATTQTISVSPVSQTVYTVTGTTLGCTGSNTSTVSVNSALNITVNSPTLCSGTSTVLTASGATNYTWTTGATTPTINVSPTTSTVYAVTGETSGCTGTNTVAVTVSAIPILTITATNSVICLGNSTILNASGASTYTWTGGIMNGAIFSPTNTATYTVTATSAAGCTNSAVQSVTVNTSPTVTVNSPTTCAGVATILSANGATSYSWSTGATTQTISVSPLTQTVYTVTGITLGCTGSNTSTVSVNAALSISVNSPTLCSGTSTLLTASGATNYTWSTGATTSAISVSPINTTSYSVVGETSGCVGAQTVTLNVTSNPTISINTPSICTGTSAVLTASGATNYTWSTGATTSSVTVSPTTTTNYTVIGETAGCTNSVTSTVTTFSVPIISINNATVCAGNPGLLTASGSTTYTWNTGATTSTITVSPATTTIYTVTGTSNGCSGTSTSTVSVNSLPTLAVNNPTICSGSTAILTATPSIIGGTYTWLPGNLTTQAISVSPVSTTNYAVAYSVNGCSATVISTISVNNTPSVSVSSATICQGKTATLAATPSIGGGTFVWSVGGQTTPSISETPITTTVYGVLYSLNGCTAVATATAIVNPNPVLLLTPSASTLSSMETVNIIASGGGTYIWSTGETGATISANPQHTTTYCATLTTVAGCVSDMCINIIVEDGSSLYVPNVFTPNGDGINDVFYTPGYNIISYRLEIFNRWGERLFSSDEPSKGWDGSFGGKTVPDGVYVYLLDAKGADDVFYKKAGHITIFK